MAKHHLSVSWNPTYQNSFYSTIVLKDFCLLNMHIVLLKCLTTICDQNELTKTKPQSCVKCQCLN